MPFSYWKENTMEQERKIQMSEKLVNDLINYLITKPYREVAQFIGRIHQEAQESSVTIREVDKEGEPVEGKSKDKK